MKNLFYSHNQHPIRAQCVIYAARNSWWKSQRLSKASSTWRPIWIRFQQILTKCSLGILHSRNEAETVVNNHFLKMQKPANGWLILYSPEWYNDTKLETYRWARKTMVSNANATPTYRPRSTSISSTATAVTTQIAWRYKEVNQHYGRTAIKAIE